MIALARKTITRAMSAWVHLVTSFPRSVLLMSLLLTAACGFYAARHLGVITDTAGMLSEKLRYLQVYRHFKKEFPHSCNRIVVVIDAITPDLAADARDQLGRALRERPTLFPWVYLPGDDSFFKQEGLLFLSQEELEGLADNLAQAEPLLAAIVREPDLNGFFSMLNLALEAKAKGESVDLSMVFTELSKTFEHVNAGKFYQMSWMRLMSGSGGRTRQFIIVQPAVNYETVLPGRAAITAIRQIVRELALVPDKGVKVMLTGDIPMQFDELKSVTKGAKTAGILSFIMVSIVLITGLGSFRLVLATLAPLVAGLVWTACFAAAAVGHLNMISVAFAVLFIGLSVDYAIHLCLRYRELLVSGLESREALIQAVQDVGPSLVLCAVTTSIGFYSFMPTDFSGVAELGLIAGTGMFLGLFANLTILPAVISLLPLSASVIRPYYLSLDSHSMVYKIIGFPYKKGRIIRLSVILIILAACWYIPRVRFDSNPINLRAPDAESILAFKKLLQDPDSSPWSLESLAHTQKEAIDRTKKFQALKMVKHAINLMNFVPDGQLSKLDIIDDMSMIMEPVFAVTPKIIEDTDPGQEVESIRKFLSGLRKASTYKNTQEEAALISQIEAFLQKLDLFPPGDRAAELHSLRDAVLGSFPGRIHDLKLALSARAFTEQEIPEQIRSEWIGTSGDRRIDVVPEKNPQNDREIAQWVAAARTVDPDVTGYAVLIMEGGRAVLKAFREAFSTSLAAIALLLLVMMPWKRDAVIAFCSLILAGLLTGIFMAILHIDLNFANIIALPLILGIGVDNGIHIAHRHRKALKEPINILQTSTARAIFFSTLTTICSFGNLAVSPHLGMASMGKLLTIGIAMALLTAIIIMPAFLAAWCRE